jgi:hypothetical protein
LVDDIETNRLVDEAEAKRLVDEAEAKILVDEVEEKWVVNEAEAKKKTDEFLKHNLSQNPSTPSIPNMGIVNVPPQEYTHKYHSRRFLLLLPNPEF